MFKDVRPNIHVIYSPAAAGPEVELLAATLRSVSPEVSVREEEPGTYGAWEWLLPAAVMVYIGKGLLDGFLKEIGAGPARSLKTALVSAFRKGKSTGTKWSTVTDMQEYLKAVKAAEKSGMSLNTVATRGKSQVPLRISADLPHGIEARFVFPIDLDDEQVRQALDELVSVLPFAFARDQRRAELLTIRDTDPYQAARLARSERQGHGILGRQATYVFEPEKLNWTDADEELA